MSASRKSCNILVFAAVAFLFCSSAQAGPTLYSLTETSGSGVNATPNQTNVSYNAVQNGFGSAALAGGDVYNNSGNTWFVTSLTVWAVDNEQLPGASDTPTEPANFATGLALVGGAITSGTSPYGSAATVSSSYSIAAAPYSGSLNGTNYLSPSGKYDGVWQLTFDVTGLTIAPGETYAFAVSDPAANELALNATTCVTTACASDGIVIIDGGFITGAYNYQDTGPDQAPPSALISADVNVELGGTESPEPTTWVLLGVGIGVLGLVRRRRH